MSLLKYIFDKIPYKIEHYKRRINNGLFYEKRGAYIYDRKTGRVTGVNMQELYSQVLKVENERIRRDIGKLEKQMAENNREIKNLRSGKN